MNYQQNYRCNDKLKVLNFSNNCLLYCIEAEAKATTSITKCHYPWQIESDRRTEARVWGGKCLWHKLNYFRTFWLAILCHNDLSILYVLYRIIAWKIYFMKYHFDRSCVQALSEPSKSRKRKREYKVINWTSFHFHFLHCYADLVFVIGRIEAAASGRGGGARLAIVLATTFTEWPGLVG